MSDVLDGLQGNLQTQSYGQSSYASASMPPSPPPPPPSGLDQLGQNIDNTPVIGGLKQGATAGLGILGNVLSAPSRFVENTITNGKGYEGAGFGLLSTPARIALDPLNFLTFGAGGLAKIGVEGLTNTLAKEGTQVGARLLETKFGTEGANTLRNLADESGHISLTRQAGIDLGKHEQMLLSQGVKPDVARQTAEDLFKSRIIKGETNLVDQGGLKLGVGIPFTNFQATKTILPQTLFGRAGAALTESRVGQAVSQSPIVDKVLGNLIYGRGVPEEALHAVDLAHSATNAHMEQAEQFLAEYQKVFSSAQKGIPEAKDQLERMNAILTGETSTHPIGLAAKDPIATPVREAIDQLGARAVELGLINPETYIQGRGVYLPRLYEVFEKDPDLVQSFGGANAIRIQKQELGRAMARKDLSEETRQKLGEITNPGFLAAKAIGQLGGLVEKAQLYRDLVQKYGVDPVKLTESGAPKIYSPSGLVNELLKTFSKAPMAQETRGLGEIPPLQNTQEMITGALQSLVKQPQTEEDVKTVADILKPSETVTLGGDYVRMPESKAFGAAAGAYLPRPIAEFLQTGLKSGSVDVPGMGLLNFMTGRFKAFQTVYSPGQQVRNLITNQVLTFMKDPAAFRQTQKALGLMFDSAIRGRAVPEIEEMKALGVFDQTFFGNELQKHFLNQLSGSSSTADFMSRLNGLMKLGEGSKVENFLGGVRSFSENWSKATMYLHARSLGASPLEAKKVAEETIFAYNKVTPFIKTLRGLPIPFLTFQIKASPFILKTAAKYPGRLSLFPKLEQSVENITADQQAQEKFLPDWMAGMVRLPIKDGSGNYLYYNPQFIYPWGNLFDEQTGLPIPTFQLTANPFLTEAYQQVANKDFYFNKPIASDRDIALGNEAGARLEHAAGTFLPRLTPIVGRSAQNIGNAIQGTPQYSGTKRDLPTTLLGELGGIKLYPADVTKMQRSQQNQTQFQIDNLKKVVTQIARDQSLTPEQRTAQIHQVTQKIYETSQNKP